MRDSSPHGATARRALSTVAAAAASLALLIGAAPGASATTAPAADPSPTPAASSPASSVAPSPSPEATSTPSSEPDPETTATARPSPTSTPEPTVSPSAQPSQEPTDSPSAGPVPEPTAAPETTAPPADTTDAENPTATPAEDALPDLSARTPSTVAAAALPGTFSDVSANQDHTSYSEHADAIAWMAGSGISTGWLGSDGEREFRPTQAVTRDAMAAFLYRYAAPTSYTVGSHSLFRDVSRASSDFYVEISWLADHGISEGWPSSRGAEFRPHTQITRDAMAAFLYRFAGEPLVALPSRSPFSDVSPSAPFYSAIVWLHQMGAAEGWETSGRPQFRPGAPMGRDATAAFLQRLDTAGIAFGASYATQPVLRHSTMYVYGAGTLNIRSGPSTSYAVVTQRYEGNALAVTGAVSANGWIQVRIGSSTAWASGYYLVGRGGAAITQAKSSYTNGHIPVSHLCALSWDPTEILLCQAAADLERLNRAFAARYGRTIPINDSYRDYAAQVRAKERYGNLAATPGTSNHGWGAAIDIAGSSLPGGYDGSAYAWLREQLTGYNWVLPTWARPSGSKPEAWHFEYTG